MPWTGLRPGQNSPRGVYRSCRRKSTDSKMNWYTRRRSLKPSLTSWTRPSPKCPDTKNNNHTVYTLLQTNFVNKQHDPLSPHQENSAGVSTVRNPLLRLYTLLFYFCLRRARTMCLKIFHSIFIFVFVGPGQKANF